MKKRDNRDRRDSVTWLYIKEKKVQTKYGLNLLFLYSLLNLSELADWHFGIAASCF